MYMTSMLNGITTTTTTTAGSFISHPTSISPTSLQFGQPLALVVGSTESRHPRGLGHGLPVPRLPPPPPPPQGPGPHHPHTSPGESGGTTLRLTPSILHHTMAGPMCPTSTTWPTSPRSWINTRKTTTSLPCSSNTWITTFCL